MNNNTSAYKSERLSRHLMARISSTITERGIEQTQRNLSLLPTFSETLH